MRFSKARVRENHVIESAMTCEFCGRATLERPLAVSGVSFDYYGTLADLPTSRRSATFDAFGRDVGLDLAPGELWQRWIAHVDRPGVSSIPRTTCGDATFTSFDTSWRVRARELPDFDDNTAERFSAMQAELHATALCFSDSVVVNQLAAIMAVGILSDADHEYLMTSIEANSLEVPVVLSSEQLRVYKPHVSAFDTIANRLGVAPGELVHVGDAVDADVIGARHAGAVAVWLNRDGRAWPAELPAPHATIGSLSELPDLLAHWASA